MKKRNYLIYLTILLIGLYGCGTMTSLDNKNYVQYATIEVSGSVEVSGKLINVNDSIIAISVDGAYAEYNLDNIIEYHKYLAPDPILMQRDIVKNTRNTASNTGFFVVLTIISMVATVILMTVD